MKQLIIFLVRKKLGLKKYEEFRFNNQRTDYIYYFTSDVLMKNMYGHHVVSNVSLNWLLNKECKIEKCK